MMTPRPYQQEAIDAVDEYICTHDDNPCVVLPTGSGKSYVMALMIARWVEDFPAFRTCVLAHRKELIEQNFQEFVRLMPLADVGIYAAGLGKRDDERAITFASIDSIYKRAGEFPPFDCLIVDEAHHIPARGEGKYRQFITDCKAINPMLKVVGLTATPYRMGCGPICHKNHILNKIVYDANVADLIRDGYLCKLRSKMGAETPDLSRVERNHGGDYKNNSLAKAVNQDELVQAAVASALGYIQRENRHCTIWFCVDIDHCKAVSSELMRYGIHAPVVTAKTSPEDRDRYTRMFAKGTVQHICNVNVLTEGFNVRQVDCVVLLRPTLSRGLYSQMVGRGLRTHPDKDDCIVLDYAHCIEEHGPIDCMEYGEVSLYTCAECGDVFSRAVRKCSNCGWEIPKIEAERMEAEDRERKMHEAKAAQRNILGSEPELLVVDAVEVHRHKKEGSPDSIRVEYRCGLSHHREWICLDHPGFAGRKAREWWRNRFGDPVPTVNEALEDMFLNYRILGVTKSITVVKRGKFWEIINYGFRKQDDDNP
jgi:DNA repair protein RadD